MKIKYTKGYKYQLDTVYVTETDIIGHEIETEYIKLEKSGVLMLKDGYAWDGPSGPTIDDSSNMRASAEHDAFYKLMRMGLLPLSERDNVDKMLRKTCLEDGMHEFRADYYYAGVKAFAESAALPKNKRKVYTAP